jgi:hypothetical protein
VKRPLIFLLSSVINILVAALVIVFSFGAGFGGLILVLFKKDPSGMMLLLFGVGLFLFSIWWIFISIGVLKLKKWARVNILWSSIIALPIAIILAAKKHELYGFVILYLFYLIYFNLPKIKKYFQTSEMAREESSVGMHSKQCPDCGKIYDLSWKKCVNCDSQLVDDIVEGLKATAPRKDPIKKRISICAFIFVFIGIISLPSVLMSFQSVKYQPKIQNESSVVKNTSNDKSRNLSVIIQKKNVELTKEIHNQWFWKYSLALSIVLPLMSIVAGIGLYKYKDFGRKLGISYASLMIAILPYNIYVARITYQLVDRVYSDMPPVYLNWIKFSRYLSLAFMVPFMCFIVWAFIVLRNLKVKERFD